MSVRNQLLGWSLLVTVACIPVYKPPTANDPHAVVKVRRAYEQRPGQTLSESVIINGHQGHSARSAASLAATRTDALLVHPGPAEWQVSGTFSHPEQQWVQEQYQEREPYYTTETYNCGFGNQQRTCTRPKTDYRYVTKTRTVFRTVDVTDGTCSAELSHMAEEGSVYLLQFTYQQSGVCTLSCFEQGSSGQKRCEPLPAAAKKGD